MNRNDKARFLTRRASAPAVPVVHSVICVMFWISRAPIDRADNTKSQKKKQTRKRKYQGKTRRMQVERKMHCTQKGDDEDHSALVPVK